MQLDLQPTVLYVLLFAALGKSFSLEGYLQEFCSHLLDSKLLFNSVQLVQPQKL